MTAHSGDANTVVGDSTFKHQEESPFRDDLVKGPATTYARATGLPRQTPNNFVTTDYNLKERPFFVPIGNGGVLAALEKLDQQLFQVNESNPSGCLL